MMEDSKLRVLVKKKEEWSENSMSNKGVKPHPTISSPTDEKIRKKSVTP